MRIRRPRTIGGARYNASVDGARALRSNQALAVANVFAVASAMGAAAGVGAAIVFRDFAKSGLATLSATFVLGLLWAALLRLRATAGRSNVRVGWALAVPLAAVNSVVAEMIFAVLDQEHPALWRAAMQGLFGNAVYWVPALAAVLLLFGVPIAWSQRLASKGLAGQERGEGLIGAVCAFIAASAMALIPTSAERTLGATMMFSMAIVGLALGLGTSALAMVKNAMRRRFVAKVEAGEVPRFRVDATPEGKVLVRVTSHGESYRVGDFEEEIAKIDEEGDVVHTRG